MVKSGGIWRFSGVLRCLVILLAMLYSFYYVVIWGAALTGETELVFEFVDIDSAAPLALWQILIGMFCFGVGIGAMIVIAWGANRFLKVTKTNGFFIDGAVKACRRIGYGLIGFWAGMMLTENLMPWILTRGFEPALQEEIEWFPLDANFIAFIVGVILLLMAQAMDEARAIEADNKQFI